MVCIAEIALSLLPKVQNVIHIHSRLSRAAAFHIFPHAFPSMAADALRVRHWNSGICHRWPYYPNLYQPQYNGGQAGYLIIAYAAAVVLGGPPLTIFLARFEKKKVLLTLMLFFIIGNLISASTTNFSVVLAARVLVGMVQGPFYGIGAVVA